ncbi:MAG: peroxiredoxin [Gammaproteobacteria bacterium]|nr:peroxiredoxin [Gammaproteobacteria bacterium]
MLDIGQTAPDFTLPDQDGKPRALRELLTSGPVLLYFYPADFTPGCTKEACSLRDMLPKDAPADIQVLGISPQGEESHRRFRAEHGLEFPLLCDEDKKVIKAYDCDGPLGIGVRRVSYLIDTDGVIRDAVKADFRIGRHIEFFQRHINGN